MSNQNALPIVAIVGKPNVGKSTLFNRLINRRKAIVQCESGTTRDRNYETVEWQGRQFRIADTGGFKLGPDEPMSALVNREVLCALEEASLILFVIERDVVTAEDRHLVEIVKKSRKRVLLVVNKVDTELVFDYNDMFTFGFGDPVEISAEHGLNIDTLLDTIMAQIPEGGVEQIAKKEDFAICIIGEPNAGKSTLLNRLLNKERAIVSEIAGTTRDAVEDVIVHDEYTIKVVDTAGIKKKHLFKEPSSFFGVHRAKEMIKKADVVLIMFDASKGTQRDTRALFSFIEEWHKNAIIIVNKWDLTSDTEMHQYERMVKDLNAYLENIPMLFISALTGRNVEKIVPMAIDLWKRSGRVISTHELNDFLEKIMSEDKLPAHISLKYIVQASSRPPRFIVFVNNKKYIEQHFSNYIRNRLIEEYHFQGVQVLMEFRVKR